MGAVWTALVLMKMAERDDGEPAESELTPMNPAPWAAWAKAGPVDQPAVSAFTDDRTVTALSIGGAVSVEPAATPA